MKKKVEAMTFLFHVNYCGRFVCVKTKITAKAVETNNECEELNTKENEECCCCFVYSLMSRLH